MPSWRLGFLTFSIKPRLTCSRSCSFDFLISPGSFLLRLFRRLFNRLLLKMKFVGRSCLFSFHGSLTLYLPVALLNRMVWNFMMISSFLRLSSGILPISQNLVNRLSSFDSCTGMISILWHSVFKSFSWLLSFWTGPDRSHPNSNSMASNQAIAINASFSVFIIFSVITSP